MSNYPKAVITWDSIREEIETAVKPKAKLPLKIKDSYFTHGPWAHVWPHHIQWSVQHESDIVLRREVVDAFVSLVTHGDEGPLSAIVTEFINEDYSKWGLNNRIKLLKLKQFTSVARIIGFRSLVNIDKADSYYHRDIPHSEYAIPRWYNPGNNYSVEGKVYLDPVKSYFHMVNSTLFRLIAKRVHLTVPTNFKGDVKSLRSSALLVFAIRKMPCAIDLNGNTIFDTEPKLKKASSDSLPKSVVDFNLRLYTLRSVNSRASFVHPFIFLNTEGKKMIMSAYADHVVTMYTRNGNVL